MPENQEQAIKAVEALSRVATGLAFEGLTVTISLNTFDPDEED